MARRFPLALLTHAAAVIAGCALAARAGLFTRHADSGSAVSLPPALAPQTKTAPRQPAVVWTAAEVLRQLDQAPPPEMMLMPEQEEAAALDAMRAELAKSGEALSAVFDREFAAYLHNPGLPTRLRTLTTLMGQQQDALSLAGYLGRLDPEDYSMRYNLVEAVGSAFGRDASYDRMQELKAAFPPDIWRNSLTSICRNWPNDRRDDLLKFAIEENNPSLLGVVREGIDRGEWLAGLLTDESVPADFRAAMKADSQVRSQISDATAVPVEARMEADIGHSSARELCWRDVAAVFRDPRDWSYLFQTSRATPAEILDAVSTATPQFAATHPAELRQAVYSRLVETDPERALTLLADLSPAQRSATILGAAASGNFDAKPDRFVAMLAAVPDTPETREQREEVWRVRTANYLSSAPDGYLHWIDSLPPGTDRDLALASAADLLEANQPAQAAELRSRVADPILRQKPLIPAR